MSEQRIRIGLIGAGANTRLRHIPGFQAVAGVELVAVCNRSRESGERVAAEFGIARVATDPAEVFADTEIDAVCIGTWPYRHRDFTARALEGGKHVLCEARMAMNAAEAREMVAAARARSELVAQLVPAPLDFASWRTVRRLVADGSLGELREVHATMLNGAGLDPATPLHWRERSDYSGVNTMTLGIVAETVQRWLGPTERVVADAATFVQRRHDAGSGEEPAISIPDSLGVLARMASGARATYLVSSVMAAPAVANGISLYGTKATLHWTQADDRMTFAPRGEEPRPLEPDPGTAGEWRVEADFVASIREGAPVELTSFDDGLRYMQFTEAVWRSWSEGRPVELVSV